MVCDTQKPELLNGSLVGSATELVCFPQVSAVSLLATENALSNLGNDSDGEALRALPMGSFTGFNRFSGAALAGPVF